MPSEEKKHDASKDLGRDMAKSAISAAMGVRGICMDCFALELVQIVLLNFIANNLHNGERIEGLMECIAEMIAETQELAEQANAAVKEELKGKMH